MNRKFLQPDESYAPWRRKLYVIIFEADTVAGKIFDVCLLVLILLSVLLICLETLVRDDASKANYRAFFFYAEWAVTIVFTLEYLARIICVKKPSRYIFSFFGIVDLLAILPTYIVTFVGGPGSSFAIVRSIRLLRVFRVLKLVWLLSEAEEMGRAIWNARGKVVVFLAVVLIAVSIFGTAMFELEPQTYDSVPQAMYWAIVTMTTVGYGDIVPETPLGKFLSSILILLGYSLIIVPTGFVSAEFIHSKTIKPVTTRVCSDCISEGHDHDAKFCKYCGATFESQEAKS